jgi:hypothetical protein
VIDDATPSPDCALIAAERQLELLTELAEMTIVAARAYAHAAVAAAAAVEALVADEFYQSETERARALAGARDAADGFQKVSRSLRLTLVLQRSVAEDLRNGRLGIIAERKVDATSKERSIVPPREAAPALLAERRDRDESCLATLERIGGERERAEFDRPDGPYPSGFEATVNGVCADIGVAVDWRSMSLDRKAPSYQPFVKRPLGWETRPPPDYAERKAKRLTTRDGRPPPVQR